MNIDEIIEKLLEIKKAYGNIQVGYENQEYASFEPIDTIRIEHADAQGGFYIDQSLGDVFVGVR